MNRNKKHITLLIADDHELVRLGLKIAFSSDDRYLVLEEAINGFEAMELAKYYKPDLLILDLVMPEINGIDVVVSLKNILPDTKIVLFTAYEDEIDFESLWNSGVDGAFTKDLRSEELLWGINQVMQGKLVYSKSILRTVKLINHLDYGMDNVVTFGDNISDMYKNYHENKSTLYLNGNRERYLGLVKDTIENFLNQYQYATDIK